MKLYFYYGVMGASKTANALMTKFNFEEQGKKVILLKPLIDNRYGRDIVKSRIGIEAKAIVIGEKDNISDRLSQYAPYDAIIVDEAHFLSASQIDELRLIAISGKIVMCYGLRTDFKGRLFEGSRRLFEVADTFREIKTMCRCGKKAIMNARYQDGKIVYDGEQIEIGGNEKYKALCYECWNKGKRDGAEKDTHTDNFI